MRLSIEFDSGLCPDLDAQYAVLLEMERLRNAHLTALVPVTSIRSPPPARSASKGE